MAQNQCSENLRSHRTVSVQLHWLGSNPLDPESVRDSLAREGILVESPDELSCHKPKIVLFDHVDDGVCGALKEDSHLATDRVLAVATRRGVLTGDVLWKLLQNGASDVFAWEDLAHPGEAIAARLRRYAEIDELLDSPLVQENLVGRSLAWISVLRQVIEVGRFSDASVLVMGESGTGKELVARLIHSIDPRESKGNLVVLDCTTVSPELAGSEFFGHERGAFTHAIANREGAFALADGGTLFLDEVGELPMTLQAELLRVVQEGAYKRVGSNTWRKANFRLICATNRNLAAEQSQGRFRSDFYYRIASWTCTLPSLHDRREDIQPLVSHFLKQALGSAALLPVHPAVRDYLLTRQYPGNVRELRQLIHRIAKRHVGNGLITVGDIPEEERLTALDWMLREWHDGPVRTAIRHALAQGVTLREISAQTAELAIQIALEDEGGNLHRAAQRLGVTDRALQLRRAGKIKICPSNASNTNDSTVKSPEPPPITRDRGMIEPPFRSPH